MLGVFLTAAYPSEEACIQALKILHEKKVSLIELGIPFSDPLADGPVIQNASFTALSAGINIDKIFDLIKKTRLELGLALPQEKQSFQGSYGLNNLIFFSYYNPLYVYGIERLAKKCKEHGVKGLLIPDLPIEEATDVSKVLKQYGLTLTLLVAVTSTEERVRKIVELSEPFVYLVSRLGVTGSDSDIAQWKAGDKQDTEAVLVRKIHEIRKYAPEKPIGLGFGIDSAAKVRETLDLGVELAIVGTKAIRVLENDINPDLKDFSSFIGSLIFS